MLITSRRQADPRFLQRADPAFWHPAYEGLLEAVVFPLAPLGDFITHLTYGPIVVGRKLPLPPTSGPAVALINQGQLGYCGLDLRRAARLPVGCTWDRPAARVQAGDLLLARSGAGSLGKNRLAVCLEHGPAVVGSFVDLIRLQGLDSLYVGLFLKTPCGWGQIHRLVNGVAVPNICFDEIRRLQLPVPPVAQQELLRQTYLREILPLHRAHAPAAARRHRELVDQTHQMLVGRA